jgi:hypothetical protein
MSARMRGVPGGGREGVWNVFSPNTTCGFF